MARALQTIGEIACQCCGERVPLKQQASGHAMYKCDWCGLMVQPNRDTASDILKSRAKLNAAPAPAKEPEAAKKEDKHQEPAQPQKKAAWVSVLG